MKVQKLDEIVFVGGSTKIPVVRSFVAKMFGRLPLSLESGRGGGNERRNLWGNEGKK